VHPLNGKRGQRRAGLCAASATEPDDRAGTVITSKDEKKKAKTRARKQKAKAKKLEAAAAAAAGAANAGEGSAAADDSDSSGSEEESEEEVEPGKELLVDSRNAPDLTVMLAARREAKEKEKEAAGSPSKK
jgi:hypothetical protein